MPSAIILNLQQNCDDKLTWTCPLKLQLIQMERQFHPQDVK